MKHVKYLILLVLFCGNGFAAPLPTASERNAFYRKEAAQVVSKSVSIMKGWNEDAKRVAELADQRRGELETEVATRTFAVIFNIAQRFDPNGAFGGMGGGTLESQYPMSGVESGIDTEQLISDWRLTDELAAHARELAQDYAQKMSVIPDPVPNDKIAHTRQVVSSYAADFQNKKDQAVHRSEELAAQIAVIEARIAQIDARISAIDAELVNLASAAGVAEQDLYVVRESLALATDPAEIAALRARESSLNAQLSQIHSRQSDLNREKTTLNAEKDQLEIELKAKQAEKAMLDKVDIPFRNLEVFQQNQINEALGGAVPLQNLHIGELLGAIGGDTALFSELGNALAGSADELQAISSSYDEVIDLVGKGNQAKGYIDQAQNIGKRIGQIIHGVFFAKDKLKKLKDAYTGALQNIATKFKDFLNKIVPKWIREFLFARIDTGNQTLSAKGRAPSCKQIKSSAKRARCEAKLIKAWKQEKAAVKAAMREVKKRLQAEMLAASREVNGGVTTPELLAQARNRVASW